ncbi:MAG: prolyl oligopeptidase family serine peptidase [Eubacteriales bacterium]|nr:prolyl oligopeptidase family serine peptidase [Eubacteriales bacterium]
MEKYYDINKNGYSIRCKIYCNDIHAVSQVVLYGHGFGGHKDTKAAARFAGQMTSKYKKTALIVFDWPCHGMDARKKMILDECDLYLTYLVEDIKERFGTDEIYAYATSFGAFNYLRYLLTHENPFKKMALRCPAVDFYSVITENIIKEEEWKKLERGKDVLVGFDRKVKINKEFLDQAKEADLFHQDFIPFAEDLLILHGSKDEIVPFEGVRQFAEENIIEFIPVENADHRFIDPVKMDYASNQIMSFFFEA